MFRTMAELAEHDKEHGVEFSTRPQFVKIEPKPVTLKYVYQGQCTDCSQPVTTLEIDVDKKHFCIAMCTRCNKQVLTKEVVKL